MRILFLLFGVIFTEINHMFQEHGILSHFESPRVYIEGRSTETYFTFHLDTMVTEVRENNGTESSNICSPNSGRNQKMVKMTKDMIKREIRHQFNEKTEHTLIGNFLPEIQVRSKRDVSSNEHESIMFR